MTTLPDEMLSRVLHYTTRDQLTHLRKCNKRIDAVARSYKLIKKLSVYELKINKTEFGHNFHLKFGQIKSPKGDIFLRKNYSKYEDEKWTFNDSMKQCLDRIEITENLIIMDSWEELCEHFLSTDDVAFSQIHTLELFFTTETPIMDIWQQIACSLRNIPNLRLIKIFRTEDMGACHAMVRRNDQWGGVLLFSDIRDNSLFSNNYEDIHTVNVNKMFKKLNKQFLKEIVRHSGCAVFHHNKFNMVNYRFKDVMELLQMERRKLLTPERVFWNFGLLRLGKYSYCDVIEAISDIAERCVVEETNELLRFTVEIDNPDLKLMFTISKIQKPDENKVMCLRF